MFARLFPSEGKVFFELFERHANKSVEAARLLRAMLHHPTDLAEQARQIKALEHEGDVITHRAVELLHRTFITPIDRGDIHRLISRLDDASGSTPAMPWTAMPRISPMCSSMPSPR